MRSAAHEQSGDREARHDGDFHSGIMVAAGYALKGNASGIPGRFSAAFPTIGSEDTAMENDRRRVAIIDDEANIRELLEIGLAVAGFEARSALDGASGLALVRSFAPDCIVLDVMMPRIDGIALLPMLRRITEVPILMLTARAHVRDRIEGLDAGADDYLSKPFEMGELVARINSAMRRPQLKTVSTISVADLSIDLESRSVRRGRRRIDLTMREFDLLATLARRPSRVFTRDELLDLVWGLEREVTPSTVDTFISYVRGKVDGQGEERLIHTIRGVGYSLRRQQ
jgi:two-component system response regulator MprA